MSVENNDQTEDKIIILFAGYGVGQFIDKIDEIKDDYLLYLFDKHYNLLDIISPYEL